MIENKPRIDMWIPYTKANRQCKKTPSTGEKTDEFTVIGGASSYPFFYRLFNPKMWRGYEATKKSWIRAPNRSDPLGDPICVAGILDIGAFG